MSSDELVKEKLLDRIVKLLEGERKLIYLVFFLTTLIIPLSSTKLSNLLTLTERSVNKWVDALNTFTSDLIANCFLLVNSSIERTAAFLQNMINFYSRIITFNFDIIRDVGYILIAIYILIPILFLFILIRFILAIRNQLSENDSFFNLFSSLSPKILIVILWLLPFPQEYLWPGAILAILLFLYWYIYDIREKKSVNKELSYFELISWKKAVLLLFGIYFFIISVLESFLKDTLSMTTISGLNPTLILDGIILALFVLGIIWVIFYSSVSDNSPLDIAKQKFKDIFTLRQTLIYIIGICIGIPVLNVLIIQASPSNLVFIGINLPWLLGLFCYDPLSFLGIIITTITNSFNTIINASREIFRGLIPVKPTEMSIIGSLQPTMFLTLFLFSLFIIVFTLFLVIYEKSKKPEQTWMQLIFECKDQLATIAIILVLAFLVFIFAPDNYNAIFGDYYEVDTGLIGPILLLGIIMTVLGFVIAAIFWAAIQIRKGRSWRIITSSILINALAVLIAIIMIVPFIWMLKNSVQTETQNTLDFQKQGLIPDPFTTHNYAQIFGLVYPAYETIEYRVVTWLFNSIVAAVLVTGFLVIFAAMAGYCLAKRDFIGRKFLFTIIIAIQMVPPYVQVIPLYLELSRLGYKGSLLGVILPFLIQPFSIFLCTEFMRGIPDDYLDAARIDGYSEFQIFRKIVLPLSVPVISVMIIINFIGNWNAFMWPLLLLEQSDQAYLVRTLPLGIYNVNAELQEQAGVILALATVIILPIFIILFLAQDYIKRGVSVEGLKG
ncbi:MAG: carbohydrate ABC transporter permease [Candidatus Thorarchaeota archaeon]